MDRTERVTIMRRMRNRHETFTQQILQIAADPDVMLGELHTLADAHTGTIVVLHRETIHDLIETLCDGEPASVIADLIEEVDRETHLVMARVVAMRGLLGALKGNLGLGLGG